MAEGQIFNAIVEFFKEDDWEFTALSGMPVLSMSFSGKHGRWSCYAQAREAQHQFVFYSVCPMNAPLNRRQAVAEFITRANYGMIMGNFEMDFEDGEVRYKTSIDVEGGELLPSLIKQLVYANVVIMDRYLRGLMRVMFGNVLPRLEIERIEEMDALGLDDLDDDMDLFDIDDDDDDYYDDDDDELDQDLIDELLDSEDPDNSNGHPPNPFSPN